MSDYLKSSIQLFRYYKELGEKTVAVLSDEELHFQPHPESNSIAVIVKHLAGNMLSRFTNFLTEDGEKKWRERDNEFVDSLNSKEEILSVWNKGWTCVFQALETLNERDLDKIVFIRNQGHTVHEALQRQFAHYAYHVGQMVYLGKMIKGEDWKSLSVPKGKSKEYNQGKFQKEKGRRHFTDDL